MTLIYIILGFFVLSTIMLIIAIKKAEPYPEEWEEAENIEFSKQMEEYKKNNQD